MKTLILAFLLSVPLTAAADYQPDSRAALERMNLDELAMAAGGACAVYTGFSSIVQEFEGLVHEEAGRSKLQLAQMQASAGLTQASLILAIARTKVGSREPWFAPALLHALAALDKAQCWAFWQIAFDRRYPASNTTPQVLEVPALEAGHETK